MRGSVSSCIFHSRLVAVYSRLPRLCKICDNWCERCWWLLIRCTFSVRAVYWEEEYTLTDASPLKCTALRNDRHWSNRFAPALKVTLYEWYVIARVLQHKQHIANLCLFNDTGGGSELIASNYRMITKLRVLRIGNKRDGVVLAYLKDFPLHQLGRAVKNDKKLRIIHVLALKTNNLTNQFVRLNDVKLILLKFENWHLHCLRD